MNGWLPIAVAGVIAGPGVEANDERGGLGADCGREGAGTLRPRFVRPGRIPGAPSAAFLYPKNPKTPIIP